MKLNKKTLSNIALVVSVATFAVQVVKIIKKKKEMKKEEKRYVIQEDDFADLDFEALYPKQLEGFMIEKEYKAGEKVMYDDIEYVFSEPVRC